MMIPIIGLASGLGAGDSRCALGPQSVRDHLALEGEWKMLILPQTEGEDKYSLIAEASTSFAREAYALMKNHPYLLSIGGDHSCAVGTWSGVSEALHGQGEEL
ncbi:MAG: arginase family protein, partial [Chlamydiia bacterium]|nr:arginase family protein [Chlamydiia bacterium]